jgi:hypothetical protein
VKNFNRIRGTQKYFPLRAALDYVYSAPFDTALLSVDEGPGRAVPNDQRKLIFSGFLKKKQNFCEQLYLLKSGSE